MSKMRKSLAVLSSAITPILLAHSAVFAGVTLLPINQPDDGNFQATGPLEWPASSIGAQPAISSGTKLTFTVP